MNVSETLDSTDNLSKPFNRTESGVNIKWKHIKSAPERERVRETHPGQNTADMMVFMSK